MVGVPTRAVSLPLPTAQRQPTEDFREHVGFMGLMLIWVACTVYLMTLLQPILRPLLWAVFLVMGLTPAVTIVEGCLVCGSAWLAFIFSWWVQFLCSGLSRLLACGLFRRPDRQVNSSPISTPIKRRSSKANLTTSSELRDVIGASSVRSGYSLAAGVSAPRAASGSSESDNEPDDFKLDARELTLSAPPDSNFIAHTLAIVLVVLAVMSVIAGFLMMCIQSVLSLQDHWSAYKKGAKNMVMASQLLASRLFGKLPEEMANEITMNALQRVEAIISAVVTDVVTNIHSCIFEFLMMSLYIFFWLSKPIPVSNSMEELFKRYMFLKFICCLGYGTCVGLLLWLLHIDLAVLCGLAAVFLNFIPEVGPIVSALIPIPIILFDGRLESPVLTLMFAMGAQVFLKFLFGNIVEVKLVEADELMKMHPVIILLAIAFFGYIWGPTGMLLAVPLVAMFKVALLSERVPAIYRDPLLVVLEGDRQAPANHAKKRHGCA